MGSDRRARPVRARRRESLPELGVLSHAVAVSSDVDEVAVMQDAVDEGGSHDLIAYDLAPFLEALV